MIIITSRGNLIEPKTLRANQSINWERRERESEREDEIRSRSITTTPTINEQKRQMMMIVLSPLSQPLGPDTSCILYIMSLENIRHSPRQPVEAVCVNLAYLVGVQRQPRHLKRKILPKNFTRIYRVMGLDHLAQPQEGLLPQDLDLVLVEVEVVEVPELPDGRGGHLPQLILGQDQMGEDGALRGQGVGAEGLKL